MIASLQYAIDYRPYILKNNKAKKTENVKRVNETANFDSYKDFGKKASNNSPQLLKAKDEKVVGFMRSVANSVNDMKFSVKTLNRSISRFESNYYEDDELVKEFIDEDIDELVNALNKSFRGTLSTELTGENVNNYLGTIQQAVASNIDIINDLGIDIVSGKVVKDGSLKNYDNIKSKASRYSEMLNTINDATNKMLSKSIYEQVKFKDMKLFVNYSYDSTTEKTFELFSEGIVLDIVI